MNSRTTLLAISAPFFLVACSASQDNVHEWMETQAQALKGMVTPLPTVATFSPVAYIGKDLPDPFAPKKTIKSTINAPDSKRKKDFLESFPLDRLTMVGSVLRKGSLWALIKAPDGTISMVKTGDYLGPNFGKIITINDTSVRLKEAVLDQQGEWIEREVDLTTVGTGK